MSQNLSLPPLPTPVLDHVVVNVRDRLDAGQACYERLGFTLTPRGYHTLGSMNHLAMFGTHYLELIAAGPNQRSDILDAPLGLNGLVFATESCARTYDALTASGVEMRPAQQFSRPVALPSGSEDATFRTTHFPYAPFGRLYFCEHLTRDLVWRDEWRQHPNGAIGISRFVVAARDSRPLAELFARSFGAAAVRPLPNGQRLLAELVNIDIITPDAVEAQFGTESADTRDTYMAALCLRVSSLETTRQALKHVTHEHRGDSLIVAPNDAMGTILAFHE
jgi:hypothetical protein